MVLQGLVKQKKNITEKKAQLEELLLWEMNISLFSMNVTIDCDFDEIGENNDVNVEEIELMDFSEDEIQEVVMNDDGIQDLFLSLKSKTKDSAKLFHSINKKSKLSQAKINHFRKLSASLKTQSDNLHTQIIPNIKALFVNMKVLNSFWETQKELLITYEETFQEMECSVIETLAEYHSIPEKSEESFIEDPNAPSFSSLERLQDYKKVYYCLSNLQEIQSNYNRAMEELENQQATEIRAVAEMFINDRASGDWASEITAAKGYEPLESVLERLWSFQRAFASTWKDVDMPHYVSSVVALYLRLELLNWDPFGLTDECLPYTANAPMETLDTFSMLEDLAVRRTCEKAFPSQFYFERALVAVLSERFSAFVRRYLRVTDPNSIARFLTICSVLFECFEKIADEDFNVKYQDVKEFVSRVMQQKNQINKE